VKRTPTLVACLLSALIVGTTAADSSDWRDQKAERQRLYSIYRSRPVRVDEPLRAENVSDNEVRELMRVTAGVYPGAVANISGVTTNCPCENGPWCDSQAWILAHRGGRYDGLMLSRIENKWTVGPLQLWWLERDKLWAKYREINRVSGPSRRDELKALNGRMLELQEAFPFCEDND
jgi:hypothetical protein